MKTFEYLIKIHHEKEGMEIRSFSNWLEKADVAFQRLVKNSDLHLHMTWKETKNGQTTLSLKCNKDLERFLSSKKKKEVWKTWMWSAFYVALGVGYAEACDRILF